MEELIAILKKDKSDVEVIREALEKGYNGSQIRSALMKTYPFTCVDMDSAYKVYQEATAAIPTKFFENLKNQQK